LSGLVEAEPAWRALPGDREFSAEFLALREQAFAWIEPYYDRVHLTRAADWMLVVAPDAPVPGGPVLDKANTPWDDLAYNTAHCNRSAEVVSEWLRDHGAPQAFVEGVRRPIREHEFGGSPEGDLMQAADSISFLETNGDLVSTWAVRGECTAEKSEEKLRWMYERIRLARARPWALPYMERSIDQLRRVAAGELEAPADPGRAPGS
jgi:hypothetical protein